MKLLRMRSAAIVAALATLGILQALPAHADPFLQLKNDNGRCLGVAGASTDNGEAVIQWRCNGSLDQWWQQVRDSNGRLYLQNANSGKCLMAVQETVANGVRFMQWDCFFDLRPSTPQYWGFGYLSGHYYIYNPEAQKCLGIAGNSLGDGTPAIVFDCVDSPNQHWHLQ